jgi:hypothetical protein
VKERAWSGARREPARKPYSNGQNSSDAYKACNRVRVQEGIKNPPLPSDNELEDLNNPPDDVIEEVRDLFAQDTAEEK